MHIPVPFQSQTLVRYVPTEEECGTSYKVYILRTTDSIRWSGKNAIVLPTANITTKASQDSKTRWPLLMLEKPPPKMSIY